ncbi:MAG: hypothetical protein HOO96_16500 [Polyangiaceae bacterium]|nr:hypothetical protein [Polyangiaceae bacterium]
MKTRILAAAASLIAIVTACSGRLDSSSSSSGGSSGPPDGGSGSSSSSSSSSSSGGSSGSDGGNQCNTLTQEGALVRMASANPGEPPAAKGGTIATGKYTLTSATYYKTVTELPISAKLTLEKLPGDTFAAISTKNGNEDRRSTATIATSGATLTLTETCAFPSEIAPPGSAEYTATATELRLYGKVDTLVLEQVYTKK